jgi:hypothetical protein
MEHPKRKSSPRLPWKRGPAAWNIACSSDGILEVLHQHPRSFISLREAARILGVSTQPLRDWTRQKYVKQEGPRLQYHKIELSRFVNWLAERAQPFDNENYLARLFSGSRLGPCLFSKLSGSVFIWPRDKEALAPRELASLIHCHPSLILLAIREKRIRPRMKTNCRCEVTRRAWTTAFPFSSVSPPEIRSIARRAIYSTAAVANYLSAWGLKTDQSEVRSMIKRGELELGKTTPGKRKIFVTRKSLVKFRDSLLKSP